jgi:hypothetical protein
MDETLYLTITRGKDDRPIVATSDPRVLQAAAHALYDALGGQQHHPRALRLARELEHTPQEAS